MILVTGATGFVGQTIMQQRSDVIACPSLQGASLEEIRQIIAESGATAIIHTAAISDTGVCQKNPEASYLANVQLPVNLAQAAEGIKLICFSSDQVYIGSEAEGPYTEDQAQPGNIYGTHKLEMEQRVLDIAPEAVMLRAEWMYGYYLKKPNFLMNLLNAEDAICFSYRQHRGVTYVKEVAEQMDAVLTLPGGVYNFGSETEKTIYEIAGGFLSLIGKDVRLVDGPPRHNLWMDCKKASALGIHFSRVEDGLKACARDLGLL